MSAVPQGTIHRDFARLRRYLFDDLVHHNRAMSAGRSFTSGQNFGDIFGIAFGIKFLVLVLEPAWVFAGVALAAFRPFVGWEFAQARYMSVIGFCANNGNRVCVLCGQS